MTLEEYEYLRKDHETREMPGLDGQEWCPSCEAFGPCKVIEVLNAWDQERENIASIIQNENLAPSYKLSLIVDAMWPGIFSAVGQG